MNGFSMRKRRVVKKKSDFTQHLLQEFFIAIFIILLLLFVFAYSTGNNENEPAGLAAGTLAPFDEELQEYVRLCNQGQQYACDKVYDIAR